MAAALSEDQFRCSICEDIFNNPVSIPCGHNFCQGCIKPLWDQEHKSYCPLCKEAFKTQPSLRINGALKDITQQFKRSFKNKLGHKPGSSRRKQSSDGPCDFCRSEAIKRCLVCEESYCEIHLSPHQTDELKRNHTLTDPAASAGSCPKHKNPLERFCKTDQKLVCTECTERDHRTHEVVSVEAESRRIRSEIQRTDAEFQQMIQVRIKKLEEIVTSVELSQMDKTRSMQTGLEVVNMVINTIDTNQPLLSEEMKRKQEAAERRADELLEELKKEMDELKRRRSELQHLETTEDPLHLIRRFSSLRAPLSARDWSRVRVQSDGIRTVRRTFSKLVDLCQRLENDLCAQELKQMNHYAVDVTLDPVTAAGWLILSPDRKKVSLGCKPRTLDAPNDPRRFDSCVSVLGKQSFTSGRHYWVVQVGDKPDWDLGVAGESVNRKGVVTVRPDCGYWAVCRRKGGSLSACAGPSVTLHLETTPETVGVFLDYEDGSVSFYDAGAKTHIYTYGGCSFTEPLYPYLNPCLHDNGRNTAPLVILRPAETTHL